MRGKLFPALADYADERITPAHAGKTIKDVAGSDIVVDHPRACGENSSAQAFTSAARGSPPRMRGKPSEYLVKQVQERITPAHAGKTERRCSRQPKNSDHPRACGENY